MAHVWREEEEEEEWKENVTEMQDYSRGHYVGGGAMHRGMC